MKSILWVFRSVVAAALFTITSQAQAIEGYQVCGVCKYFEPSSRSCQEAPSCSGMEGFGYDCGHCATWYSDSERGHCETIVGCGGATSLSWPQVIWGESQSAVADAHEVIYNAEGLGNRGWKRSSSRQNCYAYNRDGVSCSAVGFREGQYGTPWGQAAGQFRCINSCLQYVQP